MAKHREHFSKNSLLALHLLLESIKREADVIELTESFFRSYFDCELPKRLYDAYIRDFLTSIATFFRDYSYGGHIARLYVAGREKTNNYYGSIVDKLINYHYSKVSRDVDIARVMQKWTLNSVPEISQESVAKELVECIHGYGSIKKIILKNQIDPE